MDHILDTTKQIDSLSKGEQNRLCDYRSGEYLSPNTSTQSSRSQWTECCQKMR